MVALLREFPSVRMTFNLVPSLLVQLEAFAAGRAHDQYLDLGMKPAAISRRTMRGSSSTNFFHAQRQRMIEVYPRYAELLAQRGHAADAPRRARPRRSASAPTTCGTCRCGRSWRGSIPITWSDDTRVRGLVGKGRSFTEEDKGVLRAVELEILNAVIPEYRAACGPRARSKSPRRRSITPFCRSSAIPTSTSGRIRSRLMPRHRFIHPEDAREQLAARRPRATSGCSGTRPVGLWPSEGSVSDEMASLAAQAGLRVDGDRRADPGAHARHRVLARRQRSRRPAGAALPPVRGGHRRRRASPACSGITRSRT